MSEDRRSSALQVMKLPPAKIALFLYTQTGMCVQEKEMAHLHTLAQGFPRGTEPRVFNQTKAVRLNNLDSLAYSASQTLSSLHFSIHAAFSELAPIKLRCLQVLVNLEWC